MSDWLTQGQWDNWQQAANQSNLLGCWDGVLGGLAGLGLSSLNSRPIYDNDWHGYLDFYPPDNVLLEFRNSHGHWIAYHDSLHPEFNVANLYWRLTGIGKHQLGLL